MRLPPTLRLLKETIDKIIEFKSSGLANNLIINELNVKTNGITFVNSC